MRLFQNRFLISALIFFSCITCLYAEKADTAQINDYSSQKILDFSFHLINKKEYYRAYVELQRLQSYYPGLIPEGRFYATELYLLHKGGEYKDILNRKTEIKEKNVLCIESIFKSDASIFFSEYERSLKYTAFPRDPVYNGCDDLLDQISYKRYFLANIMLEKSPDIKLLSPMESLNGDQYVTSRQYEELLERSREAFKELKKPACALMWGVIPGMGYVYAGNKPTGIFAFIVVSVISTLTYFSFATENKPLGIILGLGATFFYSGSIIGGYRETMRHNNAIFNNLKTDMIEGLKMEKDHDIMFERYGIPR